jgi:transposase
LRRVLEEVGVTVVMGLDQHRAQITADWLETETGEVSRARVMPADRVGVRRFLARFAGQQLEVALEATTGWRFVVEELLAVGAEPHLAEPAEASALKGNKRRAKTDRGDARHLRELLMTGRLPESYIAPEHLLDLRARVRLRHALVDQRGEWQQRIHAGGCRTKSHVNAVRQSVVGQQSPCGRPTAVLWASASGMGADQA